MSKQDSRSKTFKRAEKNLQNKLSTTFLKNYPHHLMPGYNLNKSPCIEEWDEENIIGFFQEFPYNCDFPKPLLPPARLPRTVLSEEDPALQLLTVKNHLKDDINRIINYYQKHEKEFGVPKKKTKWKVKNNGSNAYTNIPRYVADIAELIEMNPDPYFEEAYNWYYTGGSLNYIQLNGWDILLFPFMGDLVAANIIAMEDSIWKPLLQNSAKYELHEALYEIRHNSIDNTCRILGRHKNQCALYTLCNFENHLILKEIHKQASKIPYVSADLSLINVNHHCTLNADKILSLWDITRTYHISNGSVVQNKAQDAWGSVRFQQGDPNVLIYVDRCCLHYIDTRTSFDHPSLTLCPKSHLENCESLSVDAASRNDSCRYIGTYHSLLMCDNRSPKQCIQQKWTHQFKDTPLLMTVTNSNNKEIVVLSSQTAGESAIILNTWASLEAFHSFNLPFKPPYIAETLNEAQLGGMCLDPYLRSRFDLCNVGSTLATSPKGEVSFFVQNSIGDIFYQCITHETVLDKYSPVNNKACYALSMWEKALLAQPEPLAPLTLTNKHNMEHIFKSFTNRKLRMKTSEDVADDPFEPTWKQSLSMLGSYIDILAPELLAVWDVREEVAIPVTAAPHQKVLSWLESSQYAAQSQPEYVSTPVNTQELISVSQQQDIACIDDSNVLQEILLPKVVSKSSRRPRNIIRSTPD
ncbi:PREDICTED: uncharacterized protein LOC106747002 [Dinoponera quadriceps]|uniref:Uncharacterized protein LOC106747002 n=1 Tax=Dinoponera quadriceps TaxID=609295 RepID=A0A6P3XNY7_DINQU|nr:PREDICTED: uncharacterized protein LOC106747002 [Dinoponera quadriceps]XP_014479715.1 PREDICTED: uncharacterized protein LOC106747002 [Dinoponera quadriceps]